MAKKKNRDPEPQNEPAPEIKSNMNLMAVVAVGVAAFAVLLLVLNQGRGIIDPGNGGGIDFPSTGSGIETFEDQEQFEEYIKQNSGNVDYNWGFGGNLEQAVDFDTRGDAVLESAPSEDSKVADDGGTNEYSQTNNQILLVDEPDILKNDGERLYFLTDEFQKIVRPFVVEEEEIFIEPDVGVRSDILPIEPYYPERKIQIIDAVPATNMQIESEIRVTDSSNLLLDDDSKTLVSIGSNSISGHSVVKPNLPVQSWEYQSDSNYIYDARLYEGKLYIFMTQNIYPYDDGAFLETELLRDSSSTGNSDVVIDYPDIAYIPNPYTYSDTLKNILVLNPASGEVVDSFHYLGDYRTALFFSDGNIYLTQYMNPSQFENLTDFISQNPELFSTALQTRAEQLESYDIEDHSKHSELSTALDKYVSSLSREEQLNLQNTLDQKLKEYVNGNEERFGSTRIVKIDADTLKHKATGEVPGVVENQYWMDEHKFHLRVASKISLSMGIYNSYYSDTESMITVLDRFMDKAGSVGGLGQGEDLYSVRFAGDTAYAVTFRQIDPFYVVDLSDPTQPVVDGELKIPGFSSYLHVLDEDLILGVGYEDGRVKLSLFNTQDPTNPLEVSRFSLPDYFSEVAYNPRAFLHDTRNNIFFIPGQDSAYIFSYENEELKIAKSVFGDSYKRAAYIGNNLYMISDQKIIVYDMDSWKEVSLVIL